MLTEFIERAIIVVNKGNQIAANAIAKQIDLVGGELTFEAELSPSGNPLATHFWANWQLTPGQRNELGDLLDAIPGQSEQVFDLSSFDPALAEPTPSEVLAAFVPPLQVVIFDDL